MCLTALLTPPREHAELPASRTHWYSAVVKAGSRLLGEYRWAFDNACEDVRIEGLVPHGLRHTTAALAISAGANVKVVQRLLGHATAAMTLDRYGHLLNDDLTGVADALGKAHVLPIGCLMFGAVSASCAVARSGGTFGGATNGRPIT